MPPNLQLTSTTPPTPIKSTMSYGHHLDANPFSDPSTGQNPFQQSNESAFSLEDVDRPAPQGGVENIGAYVADHDRRARELEAKQRELEQREATLAQREAEVGAYVPNWPPCECSSNCLLAEVEGLADRSHSLPCA